MIDTMCMALGGRAAEDVVFHHLSTGAQDDLQRVTKMAYAQISTYGFSSSVLRHLSFPRDNGGSAEGFTRRPYSDETAHVIDIEAKKLGELAYERTKSLLMEKRELLDKVAEYLIQHEVCAGR